MKSSASVRFGALPVSQVPLLTAGVPADGRSTFETTEMGSRKDSIGFNFWPDLTVEDCGELARATAAAYEKLLRRFDDEGLEIIAKYRSSEGIPYQNTYREHLTHVLMHSSIHRGNIMLKLREEGFEPPKIDYIIYLRETKYI